MIPRSNFDSNHKGKGGGGDYPVRRSLMETLLLPSVQPYLCCSSI